VSGVHAHVPATPVALVLQTCPVPVHEQSMVLPQPSGRSWPHWFAAQVFGLQHWPDTQVLPPVHPQVVSPQAFVNVTPH